MKRQMIQLVAVLVAMSATGSIAQAQSRLMRYPDVHGDKIVFRYEGDLWLVSAGGGDARRITRDVGVESLPKFSPDGQHIAFTAQYDGGVDVYVMDAGGGVPQRLTYHPSADRVLDWFPDGKHLLFRSRREYSTRVDRIYKLSIDGGMPVKLPVDRAGLTTLSPDGKRIAYNRISREQRTWKRHQGGTAQDIWLGSLEHGDFKKITDWPGTDNFPMWHDDSIYFTSDREHGTLNIYRYDLANERITALTAYKDYDVRYPSIGPEHIVYQYGGALHLLDLNTKKTRMVPINIPTDRTPMRSEFVEVSPKTGSFSLSPSGKRMLLEARGEILNLPAEDGEPINLTKTTGTREKNAAWSPDGRWIAFISDKTGEEEVYLVDQKGEKPWKQLTSGGQGFRKQLLWSPDGKWLLFSDKFLRLNLVDAGTGDITVIDVGEYDDGWYRWGIQEYVWSPDSRWVAYTKLERSLNEAIFLYSMTDRTAHRVTDEFHEDWSPSFDPQGRYLYFLSHRTFNPLMGFIDQNFAFFEMARPHLVILKDDQESPFAPKDSLEEITDEQEKNNEDKSASKGEDEDGSVETADESAKDKAEDEITEIDLEGIDRRIVVAEGVPAGNYFRLEATDKGFLYLQKDGPEFEKYQTVTDSTKGKLDLYHYDLEDKEAKKILGGIANYHLSGSGKKLVYRAGAKYGVVDAGKKAEVGDGQVTLDNVRIRVVRDEEFLQIFNEAWRVQRDWFYDPGMHGLDWKATGDKYRKLIPDCGTRGDLNYLIGEMIAELNVGHTYVFGGDIAVSEKKVPVGLLGATFETVPGADYYRIAHIYPGTPWKESERSPLAGPGCPIQEGDYLIAIDGAEVRTTDNVYAFLQNKRKAVVTLTYNDNPSTDGAESHRVTTISRETPLQYREWVEKNRAVVDEATGGQVGYLHIPDMGRRGLVEFARAYFPLHYKKGLIIDERYNGGGFTSSMIVDRLERQVWSLTQPREGKYSHDPERCFHGHLAVVVNEDTGSSGESFAMEIQVKKLAPIIGVRTWGGAVGYELHQLLVDGGGTTPPQFACYGLNGRWLIEGHGIDPDIEVQNFPGDVLRGKDAQLEAAIDYIVERLKDAPKEIPPRPAFPDKSKKE